MDVSDAEVEAANETCSCAVQYTNSHSKSPEISLYYTETTSNTSTETLKPQNDVRYKVKYEYEKAPSLSDFSAIKRKSPSDQMEHKSTETVSTVTGDASTVTNDWWSPILDERKKAKKRISIGKKSSIDYQRVTAKRKSRNIHKLNILPMTPNSKLVTFKSKPDIIHSGSSCK